MRMVILLCGRCRRREQVVAGHPHPTPGERDDGTHSLSAPIDGGLQIERKSAQTMQEIAFKQKY
jgi:hypothetical protein